MIEKDPIKDPDGWKREKKRSLDDAIDRHYDHKGLKPGHISMKQNLINERAKVDERLAMAQQARQQEIQRGGDV